MRNVYLDFEFNSRAVLCCVACDDADGLWAFDLRRDRDREKLRAFLQTEAASNFVSYAATAEMESILRLGLDLPSQWIDLMPETYQLSMTHPVFRTANGYNPKSLGLLDALALVTGVPDQEAKAHKIAMRNLIIGQDSWTDDEFGAIVEYCANDVFALPRLWRRIIALHGALKSPWRYDWALYRGRVQKAVATMRHRSPGMPVNPSWLASIYDHKLAIIHAQVDEVARQLSGYQLFQKTPAGAKVDFAECSRYALEAQVAWARSDKTGKPIINEEYLDDFCRACPSLRPFKEARDLIVQLAKNRWLDGDPANFQAPLIQEGRDGPMVQPVSLQYYTKTGRAQPLVNRGHILNARPFVRTAVKPPKGKVIVACDWSQQEIAIALHEFPDERLRAAYETRNARGKRDIYTALARMAGALEGITDEEVAALVRQSYKAVQLGLGYGMGADALGRKLYADLNAGKPAIVITREAAADRAADIYGWHKRTFQDYWAGVDRFVRDIRAHGYYVNRDGWIYWADAQTPQTQLQNIKMQGNGASMLHFALLSLSRTDIEYLADHHDAIYCLADEADGEAVGAEVTSIMNAAAQKVIGDDITITVDTKIITHEEGYQDPRATAMVRLLNERLLEVA